MKKVVAVISVVLLYTILGIWLLDISKFVELTRILMLLFVGVLGLLFLRKGFYWYATFMMEGRKAFNKHVDRPRVFLFSILFPALILIYLALKTVSPYFLTADTSVTAQTLTVLYFSVIIALFSVFAMLLFFTLSKKFERVFLPAAKKIVGKMNEGRKSIKSERVGVIFDALVEKEYLIYTDLNKQRTDRAGLIEIFTQKKLPEQPQCRLTMNNVQTKYFFEGLKKEAPIFTLSEYSNIFGNINGNPSYKSISSSAGNAEKTSYRSEEYREEIATFFKALEQPAKRL